MTTDAQTIMARAEQLGGISEEPGRLTRRYGTEAMTRANALVAEWMRAAGMDVRRDAIGNLLGRYAGADATAPTLLLGSHLDTVRDAGKYDGPLGVLVALAVVERLHARGARLPFTIEVVAFADEEGVRFHTAYLGSAALAGAFDPAWLALRDQDGIALADAIRAFGGDPAALGTARRNDLLGYCEVHIEQGPQLEAARLPVGLVTAIAGQSRANVSFGGVAGHAGTVPMALRRDALSAAAEFILAVEALARATDGLVATVGQIAALPGASNVIPGQVTLSLDVRHAHDAQRHVALQSLRTAAERIVAARGLTLDWAMIQDNDGVVCDARLSAALGAAIETSGVQLLRLPSGAGHDGVKIATIAPFAMLFVRCAGGISHNPAESVTNEDVAVAIDVLTAFVLSLG